MPDVAISGPALDELLRKAAPGDRLSLEIDLEVMSVERMPGHESVRGEGVEIMVRGSRPAGGVDRRMQRAAGMFDSIGALG